EQEVALVPGPGRVVAAGERQPDRELRTAHEVFRRAQRGAGGQVGDLPFARQPDPADPVGRPRGHDPRNGPDLVCQPARRTLHSHPPQSLRKTTLHANRKVLHVRPIDTLVRSLPEGRVVTDPDVIDSYARDRTFVEPGKPLGAVLARSRDDVVTTLRWASEHRVPVVPRGAGTGLAGGATAGDGALVLSLARMDAVRELSSADQIAVAEPGVITADLDRAAREHGLMYAPDPSSYEISTIGGTLATNAGGLRCVKYGVTRDSALGLEVVLADGRILNTGRRTMKGVTGYDLTGLFVGSEGTLGVITAATLRLRPVPASEPATFAAEFGSLRDAGAAVSAIMAAGCQ